MSQVVISALGPDRPGIVARVTRVLVDHGCNIADSHMGLLSGRFTMMLVVSVPEGLDEKPFLDDLIAAGGDLELDAIHAHHVGDAPEAAPASHVVTVYGADHPGIVASVTEALAAAGASVTDLQTRLAGELYVMTIEVSDGAGTEEALREVASAQSVEVSVRPIDTDALQAMAVREVLRMPHPALKQVCVPVEDLDLAARVAADLIDTMEASPRCVGIAAPQIGEVVRMAIVDVTGHKRAVSCAGRLVLVNPVVVESAGSIVIREGCLSIPDFTGDVRRAETVVIEAVDVEGAPLRVEADAFEARCLLHELDHLDGVLFLDRVESASAVFRRKSYG